MANRTRALKATAATCLAITVIAVAAWSWMAFAPTGLSEEVARVEARYAKASGRLERRKPAPPPPVASAAPVAEAIYPGDEEVVALSRETKDLIDETSKFLSANPDLLSLIEMASPQMRSSWMGINTAVLLPGDSVPSRIPPEYIEDLTVQVTYRMPSAGERLPNVDAARLAELAALVQRSRELDVRIARMIASISEAARTQTLRTTILGSYKALRNSRGLLERLELFLDDHSAVVVGVGDFVRSGILLDLWSIDASDATPECMRGITELLDAVDARYADVEWQRSVWEMGVVEEQRRFRFNLAQAPYTGNGRWQDFIFNGMPMKVAAEALRPMIARESDAYAAALLRNDGAGAIDAFERFESRLIASGIRAQWPGTYRQSRWFAEQYSQRARLKNFRKLGVVAPTDPPFQPAEVRNFTYLLRVVAAIGFFRVNEGHEPATIDELIPTYLPPPHDGADSFALIPIDLGDGARSVPLFTEGQTQIAILWCHIRQGDPAMDPTATNWCDVQLLMPMKSPKCDEAGGIIAGMDTGK